MMKRVLMDEMPFRGKDISSIPWMERGVWPARWISVPGSDDRPRATLFRCRCKFSMPGTIRLHIAADAVYRLWMDGELVGTGPEQGDQKQTFFDSFEWDHSAGLHTIAVLVASFGNVGPYSRMQFRHGLLLAAEGSESEAIQTNSANWAAAPIFALGGKPSIGWMSSIGEELVFDLSGWPEGAERGAGGDFGPVIELEAGADARLRNEYRPTPLLYPATLPSMIDKPVPMPRVIFAGANEDRQFHPAANCDALIAVWEEGLLQGKVTIPPHTRIKVLLALDNYYCAVPELTVSGGAGAEISVGWCEGLSLNDNDGWGRKEDRREWADRYFIGIYDHFCPDGRKNGSFFTLNYRAGRFVSIEVTTREEALEIDHFAIRESRYPVEFRSQFSCGDARFDTCAGLSKRTLEMCSHDTFMDCPFYEQLMYVGDTRIQALITMAAGNDTRLVEKSLRLFMASRLPSGLVQSRYPSRITQVIPTFTPYFIGMALDYVKWRGGKLSGELFAAACGSADAFAPWINADGLLEIDRGWNFVDWAGWPSGVPPEGEYGVSGVLNAQYLYTLEMIRELCVLMDSPERAAYYQRKQTELVGRFIDAFWDSDRRLFADTQSKETFSEHAQIFALLSHALPNGIRQQCANSLFRQSGITPVTVYFMFYLFEVFREFGRPDLLVERLEVFFDMGKLGLSTMLEAPEPSRSDCHAWSAHPFYHFLTTLLGVRPQGFGFRSVEVRPQLGPLKEMHGCVTHAAGGKIEVFCTPHSATVIMPEGIFGTFISPGGDQWALKPGKNKFCFGNTDIDKSIYCHPMVFQS